MGTGRTKQLKTQLRVLIYTVVAACLVVVALCAVTTYSLIRSSDTFFQSSQRLDAFYTHADAMKQAAVDYLVQPNEDSLLAYQQERANAKREITQAGEGLQSQVAWRLSLLGNMIDSYSEEFAEGNAARNPGYPTYQRFDYYGELIQNTAEQFHGILRNDMAARNEGIRSAWQIQILASLVLVCLVLLAGVVMSYYLNRRVTLPIQQMVQNVHRIGRGEFELRPIVGASAELNILTKSFADMAEGIRNNVQLLKHNAQLDKRLLEQEYENLQMQNHLVQAELKGLQAQINPHFLFNTLNLISKKAFLHGDQEICDLMEHTASLLRYSLDKSSKISTLHEELACIQNYFQIQQSRFEGRITFALEIAENLTDIAMPAMVLQPLVENAVIHGIKDMTQGALVRLRAKEVDGQIQLCIEDNGVGIANAELEALLERVMCTPTLLGSELDSAHVGIRNVYRRLKMYYGDDMHFSIESEAECGCLVILELPLDLEEPS